MKDFAKKLAEFLTGRKDYFVSHTIDYGYGCPTCGPSDEVMTEIDAEQLERDIDAFIAEFEAKKVAA